MTFYKGYVQTKEQQRKSKQSRGKNTSKICISCHQPFQPYVKTQETCGKKTCIDNTKIIKYHQLKVDDPILYKSKSISGSVRLGKGKKEIMRKMVENALGKPCPYCEIILTLDIMSLDHKIPRTNRKLYDRNSGRMSYTIEEVRQLDRIENLHIICRKCNGRKSDFSHEEYLLILEFLDKYPIIKDKMFRRLNLSNLGFR